jgi:multidrug efflux pump subunit AcrA (membrane-fusion protein)
MVGRIVAFVTVGLVVLGLSACDSSPNFNNSKPNGTDEAAAPSGPIGDLLCSVPGLVKEPEPPEASTGSAVDPIVIPNCQIQVINKVDLACERDGLILFVATEVKPGEQVPPERLRKIKIGDEVKIFRALKEDDPVETGQLLALVDSRLAAADVGIKEAKLRAASKDEIAAEKTATEAYYRFQTNQQLRRNNAVSQEELRTSEFVWHKSQYEGESKKEAANVSKSELDQARTVLDKHEIRSPISGVIKTIYKWPGESVRNMDPVLQIRDLSRLRAEGLVEIQYAYQLHKGMKAIVEPYQSMPPQQTLVGHMQEINGVAVSNAKDNPVVVSCSEDGTVRVWDRKTGRERRILRTTGSSPVRAIACTPPDSEADLCLSGTADGTVRIWDLAADSNEALATLTGQHRAVTAVAFSLDGKVFATGGGDGQICIWNTASRDLRYCFPAGHRAAVTSLQFTPQSQLVSSGRDNTLRLWTVGEQGARLEKTFDRRSGEVTQFALSRDGRRALFDQGKTLRVLSLPQGLTEGVLKSHSGAANFATLALFSPDAQLILTAGASDGRLELWKAPGVHRRGHQVRQLVPEDKSSVTCAAFAPDGSFLVTGAKDKQLHVWVLPPRNELDRQVAAEVSLVERGIESSGGQVKVWAEFANADGRILPGSAATVVIDPSQK